MARQIGDSYKKPGRNDLCDCGSGKKYKRCCAQALVINDVGSSTFLLMNEARARHEAGRASEAEEIYKQVVRREPEHAEALHFLGIIAYQSGQTGAGLELMRRSMEKEPSNANFWMNLGNLLASSDAATSIAAYRMTVKLEPSAAAAHLRLGNALLNNGCLIEAVSSFRSALEIQPKYPEAVNNLGAALQEMGKLEEAVLCFRKAIALRPDYVDAYANLGVPLEQLGFIQEAVDCYRTAIRFDANFVAAHCNLGDALVTLGRFDEAILSCEKAIALQPDDAKSHLNLGNAYKEQGRLAKAVDCYRRAISLDPGNAGTYANLGDTFRDMGKLEEAREAFQQAVLATRGSPSAYSNMLYFHAFTRDISPQAERELAMGWEVCALSEAERVAAHHRSFVTGGTFPALPRVGSRLRIGVVSAELGAHAVAEFVEPLMAQLDKHRFHLTLFPTASRSDARAIHIRGLAEGYVSLVGLPHAEAAERIRLEQIDVLIDTTGHTTNCRLQIFAHRAAPVQISYIGYWSTTGLTEMDWMFADADAPSFMDGHFTEGLWRLPRTSTCYLGDRELAESRWEPSDTVWLGSFNKYGKIREETLSLWAKVLHALPEAKLLLEDRVPHEDETHQRIRRTLGQHGISEERVEFVPAIAGHERHMALYDRLDIALDTIPFNSGTTAFDTLWMGVPLVVLEGDWSGGRISSSALRALGREEWIAHSQEEYVSIVRSLARDVAYRQELRKNQRAKMAASPVCDAAGLARAIGDAFEAMYDRWLDSAAVPGPSPAIVVHAVAA